MILNFNDKACYACAAMFTPRSGHQKRCDSCRAPKPAKAPARVKLADVMTDALRESLALRVEAGASVAGIARELGFSRSAVWAAIHFGSWAGYRKAAKAYRAARSKVAS